MSGIGAGAARHCPPHRQRSHSLSPAISWDEPGYLSQPEPLSVRTRQCPDCEAGLQDADVTHCIECVESRMSPMWRKAPVRIHRPYRPRDRILRMISHFEWVSSRELMEALGIHDFIQASDESYCNRENVERGRAQTALSRLYRTGLLEARGTDGKRDYRITAAGRALLRSKQ